MDNLQQIHGSNSTQSPSTGLELVNAFNANFEKVKNEIESLDQRLFYEVQITSMQELNVLQSGTYKIYFTQNSKTEEFYLLCSVDPETSAVTQTKISDKISSRKYEDNAWSVWGSSDTEVSTLKASLNSISADVAHLYKTRTEINISVEAPTSGKKADGSDGGDLYDLSLAISVLLGLLEQVGIDVVDFVKGRRLCLNSITGEVEIYEFLGGLLNNTGNWKLIETCVKFCASNRINQYLKEFYIEGLTDGIDYCFRTLRYVEDTGKIQLNIGTVSASVFQMSIDATSKLIIAENNGIKVQAIFSESIKALAGSVIFGNTDMNLYKINKDICCNIQYSPGISINALNAYVEDEYFQNALIKELYVTGDNSVNVTYLMVKRKTDDKIYIRLTNASKAILSTNNFDVSKGTIYCTLNEYESSGIVGHIIINPLAIEIDDDNYTYIDITDRNLFSLEANPSLKIKFETDLSISALDNEKENKIFMFENAVLNDYFKEFYVEGLDANIDYCLRTLSRDNTNNRIQINLGTATAVAHSIYIPIGETYGYGQTGSINAWCILKKEVTGTPLWANKDITVSKLNKRVCENLAYSPGIYGNFLGGKIDSNTSKIEEIVDNPYKVSGSFNGYSLPKNPTALKVLLVGNSFAMHPANMIPLWLDSLGITEVLLGTVTYQGCPLKKHYENLHTAYADFHLSKNVNGVQSGMAKYDPSDKTGNTTTSETYYANLSDCLSFTDWDVIIFQQASVNSGDWDTIEPWLPKLISAARYYCSNAGVKIGWQQTWAYAKGYTNLSYYANSQETMYEDIVDCSKKVSSYFDIDMIIPNGTVIQNLRSIPNTFWGDDLPIVKGNDTYTSDDKIADFCLDGLHPNTFADYCIASTFVQVIMASCYNKTIRGASATLSPATGDYAKIARQCVLRAIGDRFNVSAIDTTVLE